MKLTQINPHKYIVKVGNYTQYYYKNKMLQVNKKSGNKKFVDLVNNQVIKRLWG